MKNADAADHEYYAIRTYFLKDQSQIALVESYIETTAIPALNKMGIEAVGVFFEMDDGEKQTLRMLIPYPSLDMVSVQGEQVLLTGSPQYLDAPVDSPAYERIETTFLSAFERMPQIAIPEKKSRIFELRRYESHSEMKAKKKIEMFNSAEIDIFLECGLSPVFFGETIFGEKMPNLTYMVVFDDLEHQKSSWQSFVNSPKWKDLSSRDEYKDTVSNITKTMLVPTKYSQI